MRVGQNPAKFVKDVAKPARITVAVLNYIPFLSGFYAEMLDVLKTCQGRIRECTEGPYDLFVFDNGSSIFCRKKSKAESNTCSCPRRTSARAGPGT